MAASQRGRDSTPAWKPSGREPATEQTQEPASAAAPSNASCSSTRDQSALSVESRPLPESGPCTASYRKGGAEGAVLRPKPVSRATRARSPPPSSELQGEPPKFFSSAGARHRRRFLCLVPLLVLYFRRWHTNFIPKDLFLFCVHMRIACVHLCASYASCLLRRPGLECAC